MPSWVHSLGVLLAALQTGGTVALPPLWYRTDTHAHIQLCGSTNGTPPPHDLTPLDLYQEQIASETHVRLAQIWGVGIHDPSTFLTSYGPFVTGAEDPVSAEDPDHLLWFGVEVSDFPADHMGHLQVTGVADVDFPQEATWPGPALDFFAAQPGALIGYAHVHSALSYAVEDVPFFAPSAGPFGFFAPVDAALQRIDFIEAPRTFVTPETGWQGLGYKLWSSGLRVALTAGRDNSCLKTKVMGYTKLEDDPLTFEGWKGAVRAGRTSIADDRFLFLDLKVEGADVGSTIDLNSPATLLVEARLRVAPGVDLPGQASGVLRIVQDGVDVAFQPYDLPEGGEVVAQFPVIVQKSGWIAARAINEDRYPDGGAHTAPIWIFVGDRPICGAAEGAYYEEYLDALSQLIQAGVFPTGASEPEVLQQIAAAREIYGALKICGSGDPPGVTRFGISQRSALGPVYLEATVPPSPSSTGFALATLNAPPNGLGALVVSGSPAPSGAMIAGLPLWVALDGTASILPAHANSGGYAKQPADLIPESIGAKFYAQSLWLDPVDGATASSDALEITVSL
jgi:hypothetical protein